MKMFCGFKSIQQMGLTEQRGVEFYNYQASNVRWQVTVLIGLLIDVALCG